MAIPGLLQHTLWAVKSDHVVKIDGPQRFLHDFSPLENSSHSKKRFLSKDLWSHPEQSPATKSKEKRTKNILQKHDIRGRMHLHCFQLLLFHFIFPFNILPSRRDNPAAFSFSSAAWMLKS